MALDADPHRTLGLPRGASLEEVKRAYRRLAKTNHPDAGGPTALPRFLAIQAAYEQIVGNSAGPATGSRGAPTARRRPSAADSDRTDATRRAYGGRSGASRPGAGGGASGAGAGGTRSGGNPRNAAGDRADDGTDGPSGPGRSVPPPHATGPNAGRDPRGKASLGSTSYDGADPSQFEPDWGGASWYGTTSGTYWTVNPKEYADPRKHGPEYQARARRAARGRSAPGRDPAPDPEPGTPADPESGSPADQAPSSQTDPARSAVDAAHTTTSWWDSTYGPAATESDPASRRAPPFRGPDPATSRPLHPDQPAPDPGRAAADLGRALTDPGSGGLRARIIRAMVGWLPIAFGLGWLVGELTGCGRFAASCDPAVAPLTAIGQGTMLVALLFLPEIAALAAGATLALLAAAVAASLTLSATGGAADEDSRLVALGAVLIVAWLSGFAIVVVRRLRRIRSGS